MESGILFYLEKISKKYETEISSKSTNRKINQSNKYQLVVISLIFIIFIHSHTFSKTRFECASMQDMSNLLGISYSIYVYYFEAISTKMKTYCCSFLKSKRSKTNHLFIEFSIHKYVKPVLSTSSEKILIESCFPKSLYPKSLFPKQNFSKSVS